MTLHTPTQTDDSQEPAGSTTLASLLEAWTLSLPEAAGEIAVDELQLDSRKVKSGVAFIAVPGHAVDGRDYIASAVEKGACAILAHSEKKSHGTIEWQGQTPVIHLSDLAERVSELATRFYPINRNRLIAITGTNGKTTISQIMAQWLELVGKRTAVMGTTGNGFLDDLSVAQNTTGSPIEIAQTLHSLEQQGAQYTALETSSHGLVQGRIKALDFEVGLFTNLSRDHLDYHHTMAEYAEAKRSLFTEHSTRQAVINVDDEVGASWAADLPDAIAVSLTKAPETGRGVWATKLAFTEQGIDIHFDGSFGQGAFKVPLIGQFNASNVLLAFAGLLALGMDKQALIDSAGSLKPVIGRMELFSAASKPKVVVDYAHTPDALEQALKALTVHCQGKLWVVVGCGGDRDKGKRPMMASIAEQFAQKVILSDDNPRSEDPTAIVDDMLAGMQSPQLAKVLHDRKEALEYALRHAESDDIILLAGKGHEDYQVYAEGTVKASDRENAANLLGVTL